MVASIHIPKSYGQTLARLLLVSGKRVLFVNHCDKCGRAFYGNSIVEPNIVTNEHESCDTHLSIENLAIKINTEGIEVIHGHFDYSTLIQPLGQYIHLDIVTWLRNPLDRYISHYYHLYRRNGNYTLAEYMADETYSNFISKNIAGIDLQRIKFGICERMAVEMELKDLPKTNSNPDEVSFDVEKCDELEYRAILAANMQDIHFYNAVCYQRGYTDLIIQL